MAGRRARCSVLVGAAMALAVASAALTVSAGRVVPAAAQAVSFTALPLPGDQLDGEGLATLQVGTTVYVGGIFTGVRDQAGVEVAPRTNLAAFDVRSGRLLGGFRAVVDGPVRALATDGHQLFVGGSFATIDGVARARLGAVDLATGAVTGYRADVNSNVYALATTGGRLLVGGSFSAIGGASRSRFAVLSTATGAVSSIAPRFDGSLASVGATSDGRLLIAGGAFTTVDGVAQRWAAVLDGTTGALAPVQLQPVAGPLSAITVPPGDTTVAASESGAGNSGNLFRLVDGRRLWYQVCDGDGQAIGQFGGNVYTGFHEGCGGDGVTRLTADDASSGQREQGFRPTFDRFWGVRSIATSDAGIAIAGDFTSISGVSVQGFAIFPSTSSVPPTTTTAPTTTRPPTTTTRPPATTTTTAPPTTTTTAPPTPAPLPIVAGSTWRYWDRASAPPAGWATAAFDDSRWSAGPGQLGYGDGDERTVTSFGGDPAHKVITSYFRRAVSVAAIPRSLNLKLTDDDGAVVFVNGVEVLRDNLPTGAVGPSTLAIVDRGAPGENAVRAFTIPSTALHVGTNEIAVEVHQAAANSSDLSFDLAVYAGA